MPDFPLDAGPDCRKDWFYILIWEFSFYTGVAQIETMNLILIYLQQ